MVVIYQWISTIELFAKRSYVKAGFEKKRFKNLKRLGIWGDEKKRKEADFKCNCRRSGSCSCRKSDFQYSVSSAWVVSRDLSLPWSTLRKILKFILKWYPCKISFVYQLNQANPERRLNFATNFLARINVENEGPWNILWSDEAHFTLDGAVNSQKCYICVRARPFVVN